MRQLVLSPTINLSGHDFSLNDLAQLQGGITDICNAMAAMGRDGFGGMSLLNPLEIFNETSSQFDHNQFWAIIAQEILYFPSGTAVPKSSDPTARYYLRYEVENGVNNPVEYASGSQFNVHRLAQGAVVHTHLPTGSDFQLSLLNTNDYLASTSFNLQGVTVNTFEPRYRLVNGSTMILRLLVDGTVTAPVRLTLPKPYKSRNNLFQPLLSQVGSGFVNLVAKFTADSNEVQILPTGGGEIAVSQAININSEICLEVSLLDV